MTDPQTYPQGHKEATGPLCTEVETLLAPDDETVMGEPKMPQAQPQCPETLARIVGWVTNGDYVPQIRAWSEHALAQGWKPEVEHGSVGAGFGEKSSLSSGHECGLCFQDIVCSRGALNSW